MGGGRRFFISYAHGSREDERLRNRFAAALDRAGHEVFFDERVKFGTPWAEEIERKLHECDFFLLLLSEHALRSEMVLQEVEQVRNRRESEGEPTILTVRVKLAGALPYRWAASLDSYQWRVWRKESDFDPILRAIQLAADDDEPTTERSVSRKPQRDTLIGAKVGEYTIRRRIGAGAMGVVYEAEQAQIARRVAIKVLREDGEAWKHGLVAAARAAGRIHHRSIVDVFAYGELPSVGSYLVMEYLEGRPLEALLAVRKTFTVPEVLWLLDEVLAGLTAAHAEGVVHQNLKPSNVFVVRASGSSRYVKLLDLGLARQQPRPLVDLPAYLAPEQLREQTITGGTDLYALGVIAFEMLTGRRPFEGASPFEIAMASLQKRAPSPSRDVPVPHPLDALVVQLLAKDPQRRPSDAAAVRRVVEELTRQLGATPCLEAPPQERSGTASESTRTAEEDSVTQRVVQGRFHTDGTLGQGGMSTVYRVRDTSTGQRLALKRLVRPSTERDQLRFRREFYTLAQLKHPAIVEVHEFGVDEEGPYYTMELLEGADLAELGPLPLDRALGILVQVASALAYLHARHLIHRAVAGRNIRLSASGQAKLIDFGILATMGATAEVAGTPPHVAPECYGGLPLDHRADLFALGALGYQLLTGRHAYPAQRLDELESLWARKVPPPSSIQPRVPEVVDALVMSLLSLDPARRPRSAAEVIDRLSGLAGLGASAQTEAARAYLATPPLVGRTPELAQLKRALDGALGGEPAAVVVDAAPGMGKTRLLAELALEAQLAGALVLRAEGDESSEAPYAAVRQLLRELWRIAPTLALQTGAAHASALGRVLPEISEQLLSEGSIPALEDPHEERARFQAELTAWFQEIAKLRPLALLVDDAHRCDETSAAVLATLGLQRQRCSVLVVLAVAGDVPGTRTQDPVSALHRRATLLRLRAMEQAQVHELLRGMFGDVPRLERLAAWAHRITAGNPLHVMHLARELVDRGTLRYQGGLWRVPELLKESEVPRALLTSLADQIHSLSPAARAMAEALSVHRGWLPLDQCMLAAGLPAERQVFEAIDELVRTEVLAETDGRVRLLHEGFQEAVLRELTPDQVRALHLRLGEALLAEDQHPDQDGEIGWHLFRGGDEMRGAALLERAGRRLYEAQSMKECIAPLEAAVRIYEQRRESPRRLLELRYRLLMAGSIADLPTGLLQVEPLLSESARWAGISRALGQQRPVGKVHLAALMLGAGIRWLLTPRSRRGPPPKEAANLYFLSAASAATMAALAHDLATVRSILTTVERFSRHNPSGLPLLLYISALWSYVMGHSGQVRRNAEEVFALMRAGKLDLHAELNRRVLEASMRIMLATGSIGYPDPSAFHREAALTEKVDLRMFDGHVALARAQYHRSRGEETAALDLETQAELAFLRTGVVWGAEVQRPIEAVFGYLVTRDVLGLRRCLDELNQINARGGKYHGLCELISGECHRECGELGPALAALHRARSLMHPEIKHAQQNILAAIAETHIAVGDTVEARSVAREACAMGDDYDFGLFASSTRSERALALAEAAGGDPAHGAARLDRAIERVAGADQPVVVGSLHEARAMVALMQGDVEAHGRHAAKLEELFKSTHNPVLLARSQRILEAGRTPQKVPSSTDLAAEVVTMVERVTAG